MSDTSRDPNDLHPKLREAWFYLKGVWEERYPDGPLVGLSATYRGPMDQSRAFAEGRSRLTYGRSLHNYKPTFAFDIFFHDGRGKADWSFTNFELFGKIAESIGLEWGGRWTHLVDGPHFQFRDATWADALQNSVKNPPKIPKAKPPEDNWRLVVMDEGRIVADVEIPPNHAMFSRMSTQRKRYYIDVRAEDND